MSQETTLVVVLTMVATRQSPQTQPPGLLLPRQARGLGRLHVCSHPGSPVATTAATWEPARAHRTARPHPHPRRAQAGTPRPARGAMLSPQCTPFATPPPRPRPWWGRGRRHPAVALLGSATPLLWQRFPSELVAARARLGLPSSLALSFPSFLPSGVGWGRGCPLSRSGSGWRDQDKALSHPQGGSSA